MTFYSSASQVNTIERCIRLWGFIKIDKEPVAPGKFASRGTDTHQMIYDWYDGRPLPYQGTDDEIHCADVAASIIRHLPPPQTPGIERELRFELEVADDDITFVGFIDFAIFEQRPPFISDHKTTTDLCWALSEEELTQDPQATLYSVYAMTKTGSPEVDLQWTYGTFQKPPKSEPVKRRVTLPMVQERFQKSIESTKLMRMIKESGLSAMDLPYDATACDMFGGCAFIERCNLTARERMKSIMSQESTKEGFLAKLKARQEGKAPATEAKTHPPARVTQDDPPKTETPAATPKTEETPKEAKNGGSKLLKVSKTTATLTDEPRASASSVSNDYKEGLKEGIRLGFEMAREVGR